MQFRVLGPVEVAADGGPGGPASERRRTLLAVLLAARGTTVSTVRLVDALWGAHPPPSARKSLQSHMSRLRGELTDAHPAAADALVTGDEGYRLDIPDDALDAAVFESHTARAAELVADAPDKAVGLLDEALALWRGPAFGELATHPDVHAEATRLEQLRAAATADHIDARLALGQHEQLVGELEAIVSRERLDERAHAQLMRALVGSGRQADALAAYRRLHRWLRDEVGVDPSPALQDLHERILRQDPDLVPARATSARTGARPATPPPQARAAAAGQPLIGREDDVAAVTPLVTQEALVTLSGPGGVGKTRLAEQVADHVADQFEDGVVLCTLAAVRDPDSVPTALITALGIQPTGDRPAAATLVAALGDRRLLLLLDNCEHLLATLTPLVERIIDQCPNVTILATSRERLHLSRERVWQVAPLAVPPPDATPEEIAATPAGALFSERARAVEPAFTLSETTAAPVAELCRRLDGMPLAIELAAARVRALAPDDLVARLDHRFSLLAGGPRHEAGRHRTLQAVVAWSYDLLADTEAVLFDRLSVFAGSFSLAAAEAVCAGGSVARFDIAGLLGELVDKSMVTVERRDETLRYRLLDTLRAFGARRLADAGATETVRRAHADYHVALVEELSPKVRGPGEGAAVTHLDAVVDDLRVAAAWLVDTGDTDGALRLPGALGDYLVYRLRDEITTWARRALSLPDASGHPSYPAALATAAWGATSRGECDRARHEAQTAVAAGAPDDLAAVSALGALGTAALYEGRLDDLLDCADRQGAAAEQLGAAYYVAFSWVLRVLGHFYRGDHDAAVASAADLHRVADAAGNPTVQAFAHYCHGEVHLDNRPEDAAASLEEAVALARAVRNRLIEGVSMVSLASLRGRLGQTREALELFRTVVAHWRRLGDYTHQLTTLRNLVELLVQVGAYEQAAVVHGAVAEGRAPSFGAEARRLATAWAELEQRLGTAAAHAAAERGRRLGAAHMGDEALRELDALLAR